MDVNIVQQKYLEMTPEQRAALSAVVNQKRVTSYPYYSKVRFHADRAGADPGPWTYTIPVNTTVRAFSYAFDTGTAVTAGFPAGMVASQAETNLTQPGETISGENVQIKGIAAQLVHAVIDDAVSNELFTDMRLVAQLNECVSCELSLNGGQNAFQLGILPMIPSAGGMIGAGEDTLGTQAVPGGRPTFHFAQNGWPVTSNAAWLPEGLIWRSSGREDGLLNIRLVTRREIVLYSGGLVDNQAANEPPSPDTGIRGYEYPLEIGAEWMFFLKGLVVGPRSKSA